MTLEELLAEREIGRALVRFSRAMDDRDWPALAEILAEDATGELGEGPLGSPAEIIGTIRRYLEACGPTQHLLGNLLIELDGDVATSRCYVNDMHLSQDEASGLTFRTLGDYHDRWRKIGGVWRMTHRTKLGHGHVGTLAVFGAVAPKTAARTTSTDR